MALRRAIQIDPRDPSPIRGGQHIDGAAVAGGNIQQLAVRRVSHAGVDFNAGNAQEAARNLRHLAIRRSRAINYVQGKRKSQRWRNQLLAIPAKRERKRKWRDGYPITERRDLPPVRNGCGYGRYCLGRQKSRNQRDGHQQAESLMTHLLLPVAMTS